MTVAIVPAISYTSTQGSRFGFKAMTSKAILIEVQDNIFSWLPLNQIYFINASFGLAIVMPVWLARKNGFKYTVSSDEDVNDAVHQGKAEYMALLDNGALVDTNFLKLK